MLVQPCSSDRRAPRRAFLTLAAPLLLATVTTTTLPAQSAAPAASPAPALTGAARWADTVRVSIERAVIAGDARALTAAGAMADRALTAFPNDALLLHYKAYALYRELMTGNAPRNDAFTTRMEQAVDLLERSAAVRPMAETQALLSSCHGALAAEGMIAGMRHGPVSTSAREAAMKLGPSNPRVLMLSAIGFWFTPKMWGGGEDKGYATLQRAIAAYAQDRPAAPLPAWGHAEAYAWLGQMEAKRGNAEAARAAYTKALSIEPGFVWVRTALLPALAKQ
jgi:tetratricopeptide (TPR) repeat protein